MIWPPVAILAIGLGGAAYAARLRSSGRSARPAGVILLGGVAAVCLLLLVVTLALPHRG